MSKKNTYSLAADVVRALAIVQVVIIHVVNAVQARPDFLGGVSWWIANILESLARPAIPLFVMLSGYLVLSKDDSKQKIFSRATRRLLVPLVIWFIFYSIWNEGYPAWHNFTALSFKSFYEGRVFHLYFLLIMLGLYIVTPWLRRFLQQQSLDQKIQFVIGAIIAGILIIWTRYFVIGCSTETIFTLWLPYIGYFVFGYVARDVHLLQRQTRIVAALFSVAAISTVGLNYLNLSFVARGQSLLSPARCLSPYFDHYLSPNVVIMSMALFVLLIGMSYKSISGLMIKIIQFLARASLGIYLVHIMVLNLFDVYFHFGIDFTILPLWLYIGVKLVGVLFVSAVLVWVALRTRFLAWLIGGKPVYFPPNRS